ncbi:MAG: hypothetical protein ACI4LO_06135 [Anaerovoracaceae bacterium]
MDSIHVLFAADDLDYARTLAECTSAADKGIIFTIRKKGETFSTEDFDVVMYEESLISQNRQEDGSEYADICMTEKKYQSENDGKAGIRAYKYITASDAAEMISEVYCRKFGKRRIKPLSGDTKFIYVCGSCGGTGKTETAQALAQELCRFHGKRVLYLCFEEFESEYRYMSQVKEKELGKYLYRCVFEKRGFNVFDSSYTAKDDFGVSCFSVCNEKNPLKLLSEDELFEFLCGIRASGEYDYVIIDGSSNLEENELMLMKFCHGICQVERSDGEKTNFTEYIKSYFGEEILSKFIKVKNFCREDNENPEEDVIIINALENISVDTDFGLGIKELSQKLTLILQ